MARTVQLRLNTARENNVPKTIGVEADTTTNIVRAAVLAAAFQTTDTAMLSLAAALLLADGGTRLADIETAALTHAVANADSADLNGVLQVMSSDCAVVCVVDELDRMRAFTGRGSKLFPFHGTQVYGQHVAMLADHLGSLALCDCVRAGRANGHDVKDIGGWAVTALKAGSQVLLTLHCR